jgi:hypothetical protein
VNSSSSSISFHSSGTQGIFIASTSLNLAPCFAAFSCFLKNGPFPGFLQPSSPSASLYIPIQCLFFNGFIHLPQSLMVPCQFLILICNIIGFSPVAFHNSVLLIILGHLMPIILHKHQLTNICNLFIIWVVTFHVSPPNSSTDLILLFNIWILVSSVYHITTFPFTHHL